MKQPTQYLRTLENEIIEQIKVCKRKGQRAHLVKLFERYVRIREGYVI